MSAPLKLYWWDAPMLTDRVAGIGRALPRPIAHSEIASLLSKLPEEPLAYADGIAESQHALRAAFPQDLLGERAA
ncbi:hypothetical protein [Litorisediminicola beolgyonensis]|uniref:Uncharacterized protein n=1 Tax=Litorisediminicola beolgyonensis TaxID=1173614 RepID=A0ABW3ZML0_9RHOB